MILVGFQKIKISVRPENDRELISNISLTQKFRFMEKKKFIEQFPPIDQSQILTDEMMGMIESGACKESCKKACQSTTKSGNVELEVET